MKFDVVGFNDCFDVWTRDPTNWSWETAGLDEWHCRWEKTGVRNTGQVTGHPLEQWDKLSEFEWPDPLNPKRFVGFEEQFSRAGDKFVMFCFGQGLFERAHQLHGYANLSQDFYLEPQKVHEILERILEHHLQVFRRCCQLMPGKMHAAAIADDFGVQDRPAMSIPMFREFFKPRYKRLFAEIREQGMYPWLHSCGKVNDIIEEFLEIGLKVINLQQPNTVGIKEIGDRYRGRICFETLVDIQCTLPFGTPEDIRNEAEALVKNWRTVDGAGLIASDYNDADAIGSTLERRVEMFLAFARLGGIENADDYAQRALAAGLPQSSKD